jgi:hypothetical protein
MRMIEEAFAAMEATSAELMQKRGRGEVLTGDDKVRLKKSMNAIHLASEDVAIEDLAALLDQYEIGLGLGYIEPNYERINQAFALMEAREGGSSEDDDL